MVLHDDYPELVKTALVSDVYWRLGEIHSPREGAAVVGYDAETAFQSLKDSPRIRRNEEIATQIGSVLTSLQAGGRIEQVQWGEPLPIPHSRQVIKVTEDSREIRSKLSPLYQLEKHMTERYRRRLVTAIRKDYPEFRHPTFEEDLVRIYRSPLPMGPAAGVVASYGKTRVATGLRGVHYLKFDEETDQFAAMPSTFARAPETWGKAILSMIPQVKVGQVYGKAVGGEHMGRIISAEIVEADSVVWKKGSNSSGGAKKSKRIGRSLLPKIVHMPA